MDKKGEVCMICARVVYLGPNGGIPSGIGRLTEDYKSRDGADKAALRMIRQEGQPNGHYFVEVFHSGRWVDNYEIVKDNEIWGIVP